MLESNSRSLVLSVMLRALHLGPIMPNTALALPILLFISLFDPPSLATYMELTSFSGWWLTIKLASVFLFALWSLC